VGGRGKQELGNGRWVSNTRVVGDARKSICNDVVPHHANILYDLSRASKGGDENLANPASCNLQTFGLQGIYNIKHRNIYHSSLYLFYLALYPEIS
jgi:hypothetical protein